MGTCGEGAFLCTWGGSCVLAHPHHLFTHLIGLYSCRQACGLPGENESVWSNRVCISVSQTSEALLSTLGFHRDRDRQHSRRREHGRQGRPTHQMRGREIKTIRKRRWVRWKEKDSGKRVLMRKQSWGGDRMQWTEHKKGVRFYIKRDNRSRGVDGESVGGCQTFSHRGVTVRWLQWRQQWCQSRNTHMCTSTHIHTAACTSIFLMACPPVHPQQIFSNSLRQKENITHTWVFLLLCL